MNVEQFAYITAGLYWILILCWLVILVFYWREHRRLTAISSMIGTMLVVVFLDGARTLLESVYFGTMYTARSGLFPRELWDLLSEPQLVIVPKLINLMSALTIIVVLVKRWFPALAEDMERQRKTEQLYSDLKTTHDELQQVHDELQRTHTDLGAARDAQDALTHMIVHDMRTPLTSVITGLQTLQQIGPDPELTPELTAGALAGANRLLLMVNHLLDISKMESGRMPMAIEEFAIDEVIETAVATVEPLVPEKRLTLRSEIGNNGAREIVEADREMIRRVIVNLLGNAIKFTPPNGEIIVRADPNHDPTMIRVSVTDTGCGIPQEHHARIFEKFHQVGNGSGSNAPSTGLGLAFCKLAVEAQGGAIGVQSAPGEGSTFWFTVARRSQVTADRAALTGSPYSTA